MLMRVMAHGLEAQRKRADGGHESKREEKKVERNEEKWGKIVCAVGEVTTGGGFEAAVALALKTRRMENVNE